WAPMVLGTSSLSLLDLSTGYATFAAGGKLTTPYTILEMRRANGDVIYRRSEDNIAPPQQVVPEEKIAELNSMLKEVVKAGTGRKADLGFAPQGGKTGTNQGYRDAWYLGFTANNVTGVWFGNDDFSPMNEVTGGLVPAPTWRSIMLVAEAGLPPKGLPGIPFDETYVQVASASLPNAIAGADETDQAVSDPTTAAATDPDDVSQVLKGMFSLFEEKENGKSKKKSKVQKAKAEGLVLPKANAKAKAKSEAAAEAEPSADEDRTFLDSIFGSVDEQEKPRKKKSLFNF
ncbi:MAG TPA: penicillin-binding transpeptidase domain-containing protein, partial [Aestuariivirga sp.]|nr:penicillin-binding transpeptidase domain-containing protein [Aestuariivirga sp.]